MFLFLIVLFCLEIAAFVEVGGELGVFKTLLIILLTFMSGVYAFKHYAFLIASARGVDKKSASDLMFHGICGLLAGVLLIVPGFVTDVLGALLLIPFVRILLRAFILDTIVGSYTFGLVDTDDLKDMKNYYNQKKDERSAKKFQKSNIVDADFEVVDPKDDDK